MGEGVREGGWVGDGDDERVVLKEWVGSRACKVYRWGVGKGGWRGWVGDGEDERVVWKEWVGSRACRV